MTDHLTAQEKLLTLWQERIPASKCSTTAPTRDSVTATAVGFRRLPVITSRSFLRMTVFLRTVWRPCLTWWAGPILSLNAPAIPRCVRPLAELSHGFTLG